MSVESTEQQNKTKHIGCVKWFNNKSGYGFITLIDNDEQFKGCDIFSHHSSIKASGDLYKYLVQGEYVEFDVEKMRSKNEHDHQAVNITGIMGGDLMCETRFKNKDLSRVRDSLTPNRRVLSSERNNTQYDSKNNYRRGRPNNNSRQNILDEN